MVNSSDETSVTLAARDLTVSIRQKKIISSITAELQPGTVTVLIGPNGAGKSTLLSGLTGNLTDYSGSITLDNVPIGSFSPAQLAERRAVMMQSDNLVFDFTVYDVIRMGLVRRPDHLYAEHTDLIEDLSERCGIRHLLPQSILTLSGGERQRTHFCRCLMQVWHDERPTENIYLLLDEPTSSQDIANELAILTLVRDAAHKGLGVLLVLHDLNLAAHFGDIFYLLKSGEVFAYGDRDVVMSAAVLSNVYETPVETEIRDGKMRINTF